MVKVAVGLVGRDHLEMEYQISDGNLVLASFQAVGCLPFLEAANALKKTLAGPLAAVSSPQGKDHVALLLQECVQKIQGTWSLPYTEVLLCKCRSIPTTVVDQAIVSGAHDSQTVGLKTGAGTSCGTCKRDIDTLLAYRLKSVS